MKSFKFFDIDNSGDLSPDEFAKAIEKIGIQIPTKQDLKTLFSLYDADGSGTIDYKEFCSEIFGFEVGGSSKAKANGNSNPEKLVTRLREKIATRGARGMIGLQRNFKIMDDDNDGTLDKYEFSKAMKDFAVGFTEQEVSTLFNYFDADRDNTLSFDEFLFTIRGPMNATRKKIVNKAFDTMDKDGNGFLDIKDLKGVYDASRHPDVIQGKRTENQILQEYLETFEAHHNMRNNNAPDGIITRDEYLMYYANVSCSIDRDDYFVQMMTSSWNLDQNS